MTSPYPCRIRDKPDGNHSASITRLSEIALHWARTATRMGFQRRSCWRFRGKPVWVAFVDPAVGVAGHASSVSFA